MALLTRCLTTLFVLGTLSIASAGVVDFDSYSPQEVVLATVSTGGLDFTALGGADMGVWNDNPYDNGTPALIAAWGDGSGAGISQTGGGAFDLNSFDMTISWWSSATSTTVGVTAFFQGGGSSVQTLTLIQGMQTYNLNLLNVTEVDVSDLASADGYWAMDNVNFDTTVPEPASLALVASGLIVVGLRVRRSFRRK